MLCEGEQDAQRCGGLTLCRCRSVRWAGARRVCGTAPRSGPATGSPTGGRAGRDACSAPSTSSAATRATWWFFVSTLLTHTSATPMNNIRIKTRGPLQRPGVFNPHDATRIKHTRMGVWDLYEEKHTAIPIPGASRLEIASQMFQGLPYVWRMFKDICNIRRCLVLIVLFLAVEVATALVPAVSLWSVSLWTRHLLFTFLLGTLDSFSCW